MRKLQTKDSEVRYIRVFATYVSMLYSLLDGEETTGFRQLRPELIEKLDEFNQSPSMDSFHDLAICLVDHRLPLSSDMNQFEIIDFIIFSSVSHDGTQIEMSSLSGKIASMEYWFRVIVLAEIQEKQPR